MANVPDETGSGFFLDGNLQRMIRWIVRFSGLSVFPVELADAGQDRERATHQLDGLVAAGVLIKVKDCYQVAGSGGQALRSGSAPDGG